MPGVARTAALAVSSLAAATLTACGTAQTPAAPTSLPDAAPAPGPAPTAGTAVDLALPDPVLDMELTDQDGKHLTLRSLAGTVLVVTDFMTDCQEICPMTSVNIRDAAEAAQRAGLGPDSVRFLEVTIDPRRDGVRKLRAYTKLFGEHENWELLTAAPDDISTLWAALGVSVTKVPSDDPDAKDWLTGKPLTYDLQHQDVVVAVDGDGHERWLEQGTPATDGDAPPPRLRAYLSAEGRRTLADPGDDTWSASDVEGALTWLTGTRVS